MSVKLITYDLNKVGQKHSEVLGRVPNLKKRKEAIF